MVLVWLELAHVHTAGAEGIEHDACAGCRRADPLAWGFAPVFGALAVPPRGGGLPGPGQR